MVDPRIALRRLLSARDNGELAAVCRRHNVVLLTAFGSATSPSANPNDLDVAVLFDDTSGDVLGLLDALSTIAGTAQLDLLDLRLAGPVARERALVRAVTLHEAHPGVLARAQMAAITERMDTEWLRQLDLELMAR